MKAVWMFLCALAMVSTLAAQEASVTVDLGIDAVMPGEQTAISVVMQTTGSPDVRSVHFETKFPSKLLSFAEAAKPSGDRGADFEVKTEVVASPDSADESILKVDVSAPTPIAQGPLVTLKFAVSEHAPGDSRVSLVAAGNPRARSAAGGELAASAIDGTLTILAKDSMAFACFFYMH